MLIVALESQKPKQNPKTPTRCPSYAIVLENGAVSV